MPAMVQLTIKLERNELEDAMKKMPIGEVGVILAGLAKHYASDARPDSRRKKFGEALGQAVEILELCHSF